jgi:hypothetical protein
LLVGATPAHEIAEGKGRFFFEAFRNEGRLGERRSPGWARGAMSITAGNTMLPRVFQVRNA